MPLLKSLECEIFYFTAPKDSRVSKSQRTRFSVSILSISANSSGVGPDWKANNQMKFCIQHGGVTLKILTAMLQLLRFFSLLEEEEGNGA